MFISGNNGLTGVQPVGGGFFGLDALDPFNWFDGGFSFLPNSGAAVTPSGAPVNRTPQLDAGATGVPSSGVLGWITALSNTGLGWFKAVSQNDQVGSAIKSGSSLAQTPVGTYVNQAVSSASGFLPIVIVVVVLVLIFKAFK